MIGPYDRNSYGRLYKAINRGEFPVVTPAKHNFASAINIAKGTLLSITTHIEAHIAAAERGVLGENYLLGGTTHSLEEFAGAAAEALGRPKPVVVPSLLLFPFAVIGDIIGKYITHRDPEFTLDVWYLFLNDRTTVPYVDSSKAETGLGYSPQFNFVEAVRNAAQWSVKNE